MQNLDVEWRGSQPKRLPMGPNLVPLLPLSPPKTANNRVIRLLGAGNRYSRYRPMA